MTRHLKNLNELCFYTALSCGVAFFVRLNPAFFYPILLLRLGILAYFAYVVFNIEGNRIFGTIIGTAIMLGWVGGYLDYLLVVFRYQETELIINASIIIILFAVGYFFWRENHVNKNS